MYDICIEPDSDRHWVISGVPKRSPVTLAKLTASPTAASSNWLRCPTMMAAVVITRRFVSSPRHAGAANFNCS